MTEEEVDYSNITFEEFNKLVDKDQEYGCGFCFSFGQYNHLDQAIRMVAYLAFHGREEERVKLLASEFLRLKDEPINDNIYFLVMQAELLQTQDLKSYMTIRENVLIRAKEMVSKKMKAAWVGVRAYAWLPEANLGILPEFMDSTDDLSVWQVCLQCMSSFRLSLPDLLYSRQKAYQYTVKAIEMGDGVKPMVVAANGVQALMRLYDERALELYHRLPRSILNRQIHEEAVRLIEKLTKERHTQYLPVLMELKTLTENNKSTLTE